MESNIDLTSFSHHNYFLCVRVWFGLIAVWGLISIRRQADSLQTPWFVG
jgi:hypothetical protein